MSLYKTYKTDPKIEEDGRWLDYFGEGIEIKIARAGGANKKYMRCAEKFRRKFKRQIELDRMSDDVALKEGIEVYADSVILDWKGVKDENEELLPFNRENVIKVMNDLPDLFFDLQAAAVDGKLFSADIDEQDVKN